MNVIDSIFVRILLFKYNFLKVAPDVLMRPYSDYIEKKMAKESENTQESKIDENLLKIWENIQSYEVNKTFPSISNSYNPNQFINDLKRL